jgi:hypothetical protein
MLKISLSVLLLLGTCTAQEHHSLSQLQGSARVLIVFAPNTSESVDLNRQLQLIERHSFELSLLNTVVVPVSSAMDASAHFSFENLPLGTPLEQADLRSRFHVQPSDFLVVLLSQDGIVQIRSGRPIDIHALTASLDPPRLH